MWNYRKNDYAANKYSPNIVYRFNDEIIEISLEDYLEENPDRTEQDFLKLKALSDEIYYEQDRAENTQTRKNISIQGMEEMNCCGRIEGASHQAVAKSLKIAVEKLRVIFAEQG